MSDREPGFGHIPKDERPDLCRAALDAQEACLRLFDAIEAGDLALAAVCHRAATGRLEDARQRMIPFAALALAGGPIGREIVARGSGR